LGSFERPIDFTEADSMSHKMCYVGNQAQPAETRVWHGSQRLQFPVPLPNHAFALWKYLWKFGKRALFSV
jgi:hypothetical protein